MADEDYGLIEENEEDWESTAASWIKWGRNQEGEMQSEPGTIVVGLVTFFHPAYDTVKNSNKLNPRLQIMDDNGDLHFIGMVTSLANRLRDNRRKIIVDKTIIRIKYEGNQKPTTQGHSPTKVVTCRLANEDSPDAKTRGIWKKYYDAIIAADTRSQVSEDTENAEANEFIEEEPW